jgi:hypothetical protein
MRLIKFILSSLVFSITFIIVIAAEYATFTLLTLPGTLPNSDSVVERVHLFPDPNQTEITYSDALTFWSVDTKQSFDLAFSEPEFEIRGWFEWDVWYENMAWADYALSTVKAVVVPIFAPVYEIKELYVYYGASLEDFIIQPNQSGFLTGEHTRKNTAIQFALSYGMDELKDFSIKDYQYVYNIQRKINKYNAVGEDGVPVYRQFVEKFINYTGDLDGEYEFESVNAVSAFLFYQLFLAFVLSAYFTYQNPIVINRNMNGENEVEGRLFPRVPKIGFGKRPNKKGKEAK